MIKNWQATAFNQVPDAENEIHGDKLAQDYGFKGALVPGATMAAYLMHPAAETFGLDFLTRGTAHVQLKSPLYDQDLFDVQITEYDSAGYTASLVRSDGTLSTIGNITVPDAAPAAPARLGHPIGNRNERPPSATRETLQALMENGCHAFSDRWSPSHTMAAYLRDRDSMAAPYRQGYANPAFVLGLTNWALTANAYMNPWVLVETQSQNHCAIPEGTKLVAETRITHLFEKKGHEFFDAEVNIFDHQSDNCYTSVELRAIYKLSTA